MDVLYKYMHKEHAESLLERGSIRIGTLYGYRNTEKHGHVIGDAAEGKKTVYAGIKSETWTNKTQPDFTRGTIELSENNPITLENITIAKTFHSPNYYLFCSSEIFDKNIQAEMKYDACIVIEHPKKFFAAISDKIKRKALFKGVYKCQYRDRAVSHDEDSGIHPAIIKDPKDSRYQEVRAIWKPEKKLILPIDINCRRIIRYCKLL